MINRTECSYSVFVNGRARSVIKEEMVNRIDRGDAQRERFEAIKVRPKQSRKLRGLM